MTNRPSGDDYLPGVESGGSGLLPSFSLPEWSIGAYAFVGVLVGGIAPILIVLAIMYMFRVIFGVVGYAEAVIGFAAALLIGGDVYNKDNSKGVEAFFSGLFGGAVIFGLAHGIGFLGKELSVLIAKTLRAWPYFIAIGGVIGGIVGVVTHKVKF